MALAYTRALLKLSGEALGGEKGRGLDFGVVESFAEEIKAVHALGVRLSLVVGGGNIVRGTTASREGLDRVSADYMGMLATVINALALQDVLEKLGRADPGDDRHPHGIGRGALHPPPRRAPPGEGAAGDLRGRHRQPVLLHRHRRRCCARSRWRPRCSSRRRTWTASTPAIPRPTRSATFIPELTYQEAIVRNYAVMDANAFGLCKANKLPIVVFNLNQPGAITRVLRGERVGTLVR